MTTPQELPPLYEIKDGAWHFDWTELRKKRVLIGTPCYGGMCGSHHKASVVRLMMFLDKQGIECDTCDIQNESFVGRARDRIVADFLRQDWTDLMWFDADEETWPDTHLKLLASNLAIVGAPVAKKGINWERIAQKAFEYFQKVGKCDEVLTNNLRYAGNDYAIDFLPKAEREYRHPFFTVERVGHGLKNVQRRVFEDLIREDRVDKFDNVSEYRLLPTSWQFHGDTVKDGLRLSEDYDFDLKAQEIGYKVWLLPTAKVNHWGAYNFESIGVTEPE